ncbi:MAG TPA: tripartite tricarboxylate transporter substrate binding protein [Xanthobacteraceae bacterium]|nr:tripartite tricarboxylate transporter substrate binding protein [Xanthobacteraceae bacterium]
MLKLALTAIGVFAASAAAPAQAQPARYPNRTVEIVVAYGAGGSTDLVARTIAQKFQDRLGQSVVVLNKPGGSGTIGATLAARAPPDGYTLYVGYTSEVVVVPQVSKSVKYSIDDFEPIAVTGLVPLVLVTSKNMRASSVAELIAELRGAPGKFTYGGGVASPPHVMGAWFSRINNLNVVHIPYRGGAQAVADVIGGHIDLFFAGLAAAKAAIDSGSVKALAVTGSARSSALPHVPTFKEAGVKDFELASWNVMLAPKGTPPDILAFLRQETAVVLGDPRVREILAAQGVEASPTQDVRAFLAQERAAFGRAVRDLGITIDQ